MATAEAVNKYKSAQNAIVSLAAQSLATYWATLDVSDAVGTSAALQVFMPQLIDEFGNVSATVASNFFDELRQDAGVKRTYRSILANSVPKEAVQINTRWAVKPLFGVTDEVQAVDNLNLVTDKAVKAAGRETIAANIERDPVQARYARVPTGAKTCNFCLMLASRGAVYLSKDTAVKHYHGNCDCAAVPIWDESDLPSGYDPDALYDEYQERLRKQ